MITYRIYCVTNKNNNKKYVGQTRSTIEGRWAKHVWLALTKHSSTRFYAAIRKHGRDVFELSLLQEIVCTQQAADDFEIAWVKLYDTTDPAKGYNMTTGGNTQEVVKMTPEVCEKIRQAKIGVLNTTRRARTLEHDRPVVELFKQGVPRTQICTQLNVTGAKVQKALARWKERVEPELEVGKEFQYAQSGAALQKRADEEIRPIIELLLTGVSYKDAASQLGLDYGRIKGAVARYRIRCKEQGIEVPAQLQNKNELTQKLIDARDAPILKLVKEGLRYSEVALRLNTTRVAVKQAVIRAKRQCKSSVIHVTLDP